LLRGNNGNPGLMTRMRDVEDWMQTRSYYEKLLIGGIIVEAIGIGFLIIRAAFGV